MVGLSAFASTLEWNYNGQAVALGTGCNTDPANPNVHIVVAGEELSMVMDGFGVELSENTEANATRSACAVRVPIRVAPGYHLGRFVQNFLYDVEKSANASGSLTLRAAFFSLPAAQAERKFAAGEVYDERSSRSSLSVDYSTASQSWCQLSRPVEGEYKLNMSLNAMRSSPSETISIQLEGSTIGVDSNLTLLPCGVQAPDCSARKSCADMASFEEAQTYLRQCKLAGIDGDGDGIACEHLRPRK